MAAPWNQRAMSGPGGPAATRVTLSPRPAQADGPAAGGDGGGAAARTRPHESLGASPGAPNSDNDYARAFDGQHRSRHPTPVRSLRAVAQHRERHPDLVAFHPATVARTDPLHARRAAEPAGGFGDEGPRPLQVAQRLELAHDRGLPQSDHALDGPARPAVVRIGHEP